MEDADRISEVLKQLQSWNLAYFLMNDYLYAKLLAIEQRFSGIEVYFCDSHCEQLCEPLTNKHSTK